MIATEWSYVIAKAYIVDDRAGSFDEVRMVLNSSSCIMRGKRGEVLGKDLTFC